MCLWFAFSSCRNTSCVLVLLSSYSTVGHFLACVGALFGRRLSCNYDIVILFKKFLWLVYHGITFLLYILTIFSDWVFTIRLWIYFELNIFLLLERFILVLSCLYMSLLNASLTIASSSSDVARWMVLFEIGSTVNDNIFVSGYNLGALFMVKYNEWPYELNNTIIDDFFSPYDYFIAELVYVILQLRRFMFECPFESELCLNFRHGNTCSKNGLRPFS